MTNTDPKTQEYWEEALSEAGISDLVTDPETGSSVGAIGDTVFYVEDPESDDFTPGVHVIKDDDAASEEVITNPSDIAPELDEAA